MCHEWNAIFILLSHFVSLSIVTECTLWNGRDLWTTSSFKIYKRVQVKKLILIILFLISWLYCTGVMTKCLFSFEFFDTYFLIPITLRVKFSPIHPPTFLNNWAIFHIIVSSEHTMNKIKNYYLFSAHVRLKMISATYWRTALFR